MKTSETLIAFPCKFDMKIMGINQSELIDQVGAIIKKHATDFTPTADLQFKLSKEANYVSITATINANSKEQLDKIYLELNSHPLVKITL